MADGAVHKDRNAGYNVGCRRAAGGPITATARTRAHREPTRPIWTISNSPAEPFRPPAWFARYAGPRRTRGGSCGRLRPLLVGSEYRSRVIGSRLATPNQDLNRRAGALSRGRFVRNYARERRVPALVEALLPNARLHTPLHCTECARRLLRLVWGRAGAHSLPRNALNELLWTSHIKASGAAI